MSSLNERAQLVYNTLKESLDESGWSYTPNDENLFVETGAKGDYMSIPLYVIVKKNEQLVEVLSQLPYVFSSDRLVEGALAICETNEHLNYGCFEYSIFTGEIAYRVASSFFEGIITRDVIRHMIQIACYTVDEINAKLHPLATGKITLKEYVDK